MNEQRNFIALTGTHGAGKGTVVEYLKKLEFNHFSARAYLLEQIDQRGMPRNRTSMNVVANDLRLKYGPEHIAATLYNKACFTPGNAVIESIYTLAEIDLLTEYSRVNGQRFILLGIDADQRLRYDRIMCRKSETDRVSFEQFQAEEQREMHATDPHQHNLSVCLEHAEYVVVNDGTLSELTASLDEIFNDF